MGIQDFMGPYIRPALQGLNLADNILAQYSYVDPPVGWGSTYCFTAVGVGVGVLVGVTPITKAPPAQIFLGGMFFVPQVISF